MKDNYNVESRNRNVSLSLSEAIYCINIACVCKIWNQSLEDVKYINYNGDLTSPKGSMWFTSQFLSKQHDEQSLIASDENVLAEAVGADLAVMDRDAKKMRGEGP